MLEKDMHLKSDEEIVSALAGAKTVIADPLFQPICPETARFVALPAENFSGRIWRQDIPNLISDFEVFARKVH